MSEIKPKYRYFQRRTKWIVSEVTYTEVGWFGTAQIGEYFEREEARKKMYEMNGWNYKS